MENASKALLIAAGVLVVILLIAFGMLIFNSSGDTSSDVQEVGQSIAKQSSSATSALKDTLGQIGNNKTLIKFKVEENMGENIETFEYTAEEGMTWREFINNPKYNKVGFYICPGDIISGGDQGDFENAPVSYPTCEYVYADHKIDPNTIYIRP